MKLLFISAVANLIFSFILNAQTTIVLQPAGAQGKDAEVFSCVSCGYDNSNFGYKKDFAAIAWTNSGNLSKVRSLIQFDLSMIPANAMITDAKLNLYFNTTSGEGNHSGSNSAYLQRIMAPWDEFTVTWNNQPATSTSGQIQLATSLSNQQNYLNIDVRSFIMDMVANPSNNYGFMMRLVNETVSKKLILSSSDHNTPAMRPMLVITYTTPLPVEYVYLYVKSTTGGNLLEWSTACEVNCSGFVVERSGNNRPFEETGWVNGNGTTSQQSRYQFLDNTLTGHGTTYYRLRQIDFNGDATYSETIALTKAKDPIELFAGPNPFSEFTTVSYSLEKPGYVHITVLNSAGQLVQQLISQNQGEGTHNVIFSPRKAGRNGNIFIIRMEMDGEVYFQKVTWKE